jgi:ABC-2 type transport system ATP-binding protein
MRCEIAASLLHRPQLVLLDEPTIGLDVVARTRIRELLVRLNEREGVTVFLTSHDAGDIEQVCSRVLLIDEGRVVLDTSLERLQREHLREKTVEAVIEEESVTVGLPGVQQLPADKHRLALRVDTALVSVERVLHEVVRRCRVLDITVANPPLERVLATLYGGSS